MGSKQRTNLTPEQSQGLLQVHLAEYQAITNRCTYLMAIQYGILPMPLIFLAVVAQIWDSFNQGFLTWVSLFILQIMVIIWASLLLEQYKAVDYLEKELRALVKSIVKEKLFWQYEPYLARLRGTKPLWNEFIMPFTDLVAIVAVSIFRFPLSKWGYFGFVSNIVLFLLLVWLNINFVRLRISFSKNEPISKNQTDSQ